MGHELSPRGVARLPAQELADRLRRAFACVVVDEEEGARAASALAAWIQRSPPRLFFGRHEEALAHASRLQRLRPGEALVIRFGDDPSALVRLVALPGEALRFAYTSDEEEAAQKPLVERCARALDCDLVPF
jgi:hypothetical protein